MVAKVEWHRGELFPRVGFIVTNRTLPAEGVVHIYNGRGTAEQWIKEGKYALKWTRLSCHRFVANVVRLHLFVLAYNLGNFLRRLALPEAVKDWSLRSVQVKLVVYETPSALEKAVAAFVDYYNHHRYREGLGNVTPADAFYGRQKAIFEARKEVKQRTLQRRRDYNRARSGRESDQSVH